MLLLLSTLSTRAVAEDDACSTSAECSFNGECQDGRCRCDMAWRGQRCATLNLLPARPGAGLNVTDAGGPLSSWGGTVTKGDDGLHHLFVSQFVRNCGFNQWDTNSQIVHATSESADGRYEVKQVVWPVFAHNPAVTRGPDGQWVMTFVSNASGSKGEAACANGSVVTNSSLPLPVAQRNYMSWASSPWGPWSTPLAIDAPFDAAVPPFSGGMTGQPNRNTNLILSIAADGAMVGLWRRCCSPPPEYRPPGGGGESVLFAVHAANWSDVSIWRASDTKLLPHLTANGYEDPHLWRDPRRRAAGQPVLHALFHNMQDGWHQPEYNNTQVGAHAYSTDGGRSWVDTGVAFNLTVDYEDGTSTTFVQRERPHVVLDDEGDPAYLVSAVTYSLAPTLPTCTIVQPIGKARRT